MIEVMLIYMPKFPLKKRINYKISMQEGLAFVTFSGFQRDLWIDYDSHQYAVKQIVRCFICKTEIWVDPSLMKSHRESITVYYMQFLIVKLLRYVYEDIKVWKQGK